MTEGPPTTAPAGRPSDRDETCRAAVDQEYRLLLDVIDEAYCLCEIVRDSTGSPADYRFIEVNPAMLRLLELPSGDVVGRLRTDLDPPVPTESLQRILQAATGHEPTRIQQWSSVRGRLFDIRIFPRGGDRFAFLNSDSTAREQLEARLREDVERRSALLRLSDALNALTEPEQIESTTCRLLREHLGADRVSFGRVHDGTLTVTAVDRGTDVADILGQHQLRDYGQQSLPRASRVFSETSAWCDDVLSDPRLSEAERSAYQAVDCRAWAALPIAWEGAVEARIAVGFVRPHVWSTGEIDTVQAFGDRAWAASRQAEAAATARREREMRRAAEHEFVTNASHELRTPVTGILAAVESLLAGAQDDPALRVRFLEHLRRETQRLARLSDGLLALAQSAAHEELVVLEVPLGDLLRQVADGLTVSAGVQLRVHAAPSLTIRTVPGLLEIALSNLARNAAAHTTTGRIELKGSRRGADIVIDVQDTGSGMDPDVVQRATDRFYRGSAGRSADGFGLGLSIAQQAAAGLAGSLELTSQPGRGTRARLTFPDQARAEVTP